MVAELSSFGCALRFAQFYNFDFAPLLPDRTVCELENQCRRNRSNSHLILELDKMIALTNKALPTCQIP